MNEVEQDDVSKLIENSEEAEKNDEIKKDETNEKEENKNKFFKKYKIKDIVFLSIITACTLVTGAIMPLLTNIPLFGIIELGLGLQFSLFPTIGLMKVRKPGALILQSIFISVFLVFMFPPMVFIILCALIAEGVALLIFKGYKNDWACVVAGTLYMPLTLPILTIYYNFFYTVTGEEKEAISMFLGGSNPWVIVGMVIAIIALCFIGSLLGMFISRELKKAGKFK